MKLNAAEISAICIGLRMVQHCATKGKLDHCCDRRGNPITPLTDEAIDDLRQRLAYEPDDTDDISETEIAEHFRQRIEDGDLSLEDVPARLARYGLEDPANFATEMRERIEMAREEA